MSNSGQNNKLFFYLCIAGLIIMAAVNIYLYYGDLKELYKAISVNVLSTLIIFVFVYILFFRNGIDIDSLSKNKTGKLPKWIENAYESFYDIDWKKQLKSSRSLLIISFYFEDWIIQNKDVLTSLIEKNNSSIEVILPNYENEDLLNEIVSIIPKYSVEEIKMKIKSSVFEIEELKKISNKKSEIKVFFYDKVFNYTMQVFDKKTVFLSFNELSRNSTYQSPFFRVNFNNSRRIKAFFDEEIKLLKQMSNEKGTKNE